MEKLHGPEIQTSGQECWSPDALTLTLKERLHSVVIRVVFGFIIDLFTLWGKYPNLCRHINGETVIYLLFISKAM